MTAVRATQTGLRKFRVDLELADPGLKIASRDCTGATGPSLRASEREGRLKTGDARKLSRGILDTSSDGSCPERFQMSSECPQKVFQRSFRGPLT